MVSRSTEACDQKVDTVKAVEVEIVPNFQKDITVEILPKVDIVPNYYPIFQEVSTQAISKSRDMSTQVHLQNQGSQSVKGGATRAMVDLLFEQQKLAQDL